MMQAIGAAIIHQDQERALLREVNAQAREADVTERTMEVLSDIKE